MDHRHLKKIEDELWEAADQLRANSKLTASEYAMPVLGLIFLRHAFNRFQAVLPEVESGLNPRLAGDVREERIRMGFKGKAAIYLPADARWDYLASLPEGSKVGEALRHAMNLIEDSVEDGEGKKVLAGALPKEYLGFEPALLAELVKIFNRPSLAKASGDVFGRIYEYFLNQFAQTGAQEGGEFFTPPSLVRTIVNIIEPDHGIVYDAACGSAGMFVQTGYFIEKTLHASANERVSFWGQEKSDTNTKLARMNLAVHGLEGRIIQGNTFEVYQHRALGRCDFVMANPPFNVDMVDAKKAQAEVGPTQRLPFGLPGTTTKGKKDGGETVSNANSLWIQYFYSALNATGRAGFVMASSASDAGNKDRDIRQKLVQTGHVDVMVSIGPKFFYTRSLPCTLWFFDKGKPRTLQNTVLMLDARSVYHVVSARSHVFTEEQLANLNAIVWLYRGQAPRFLALLAGYHRSAHAQLGLLKPCMDAVTTPQAQAAALLQSLAIEAQKKPDSLLAELNKGRKEGDVAVQPAQLQAYVRQVADLYAQAQRDATEWLALQARLAVQLAVFSRRNKAPALTDIRATQTDIEGLQADLKTALKALEARHKELLRALDVADKTLRARNSAIWQSMPESRTVRDIRRQLQPLDPARDEEPTLHDEAVDAFRQALYFTAQGHWLLTRFPQASFQAVPGLCKAVTREDIAANDFSLTPGRYVGVAANGADEEDAEAFAERMKEIHVELAELNARAVDLANAIQANLAELVE
jgi:type I restriction enzyme M protein